MNRKISFPIAIIIIIILAGLLTVGILSYQYWWLPKQEKCEDCKAELISWCEGCQSLNWPRGIENSPILSVSEVVCMKECFNIMLSKTNYCYDRQNLCEDFGISAVEKKQKEVIVTTDKTEYEQGEIIKITVKNGLNTPIFYSGGERFWFIEKFEDEEWKNLGYEREGAFQLPDLEEGKEVCYIKLYERPDLFELKSNSETYHTWNQKICPLYREEEQLFEPELIKAGHYRFGFVYGLSKSSEVPYELVNPKTIYSNEFTIKEKAVLNISKTTLRR